MSDYEHETAVPPARYRYVWGDELSLRDYFAAAALSSMGLVWFPQDKDLEVAKAAYRYADAMLKERDNGNR